MDSWSRTTNVNKAGALGTLGIPLQLDKTVDLQSGRGWTTILIYHATAPTAAELGGRVVQGEKDASPAESAMPAPTLRTKHILGLLARGELQKGDPHHPLIDMLGACANRDALELWVKTGKAHRLARVKGARRTALVPGDEPSDIKALAGCGTRNLKLAACFTRLGLPVCRIDPPSAASPLPTFVFPFQGLALDEPPALLPDLSDQYRNGTLQQASPNHPLLWMMQCLINCEAIQQMIDTQKEIVLIRAPGTGRASLIHRDSSPEVLDRVRQRLGITF